MTDDAAASRPKLAVLELGSTSAPRYDAVLGTVVEVVPGHDPVVEFEVDGEVLRRPAISTVVVDRHAVGHPVVLMFVGGNLDRPVITGRVDPGRASPTRPARSQSLVIDGRELVLEAESSLTLRCGKSSITLTPRRPDRPTRHERGEPRVRGQPDPRRHHQAQLGDFHATPHARQPLRVLRRCAAPRR
jgi:hypothetical protein